MIRKGWSWGRAGGRGKRKRGESRLRRGRVGGGARGLIRGQKTGAKKGRRPCGGRLEHGEVELLFPRHGGE
eukprot:763068-Hanusia_phi.AAC.4